MQETRCSTWMDRHSALEEYKAMERLRATPCCYPLERAPARATSRAGSTWQSRWWKALPQRGSLASYAELFLSLATALDTMQLDEVCACLACNRHPTHNHDVFSLPHELVV